MSADKTNKPKVKDEFLADLIRHFGVERGVELYQDGTVSKDDLAAFSAMLAKFGVEVKRPSAAFYREPLQNAISTGMRGKPFAGTDPS